ncbi:hypothetical protein [Robiginitalea sp. SC105]|uniref:hypothetical protein n=1 Tax=Robiginitalea sp. SC105 TaxID=2762332 RepID=UPI00163AEDA4|nr:hypothetical protein [Robiginitalea sp. SC105]MBC2838964.1 hypothetical protein [Robiginitalea sp. SC105]
MAPVEFEKNIKEKLQRQEIQPSKEAWERIEARLGDRGPRRNRNRLAPWAYGAAAALVIALGVRMMTLTDPDPVSGENPELASPEAGKTLPAQDLPGVEPGQPADPVPSTDAVPPTGTLASDGPTGSQPEGADRDRTGQTPKAAYRKPGKTDAALALSGKKPDTGETHGRLAPEETADLASQIDRQVGAVLEEVALLESEGARVSDAEIDSLLREARERIAAGSYRMPRDSVDALSLLSDAEEELDQTFREELFDKLKTGFMKVRTAVADRNN